MPEIPYLYNKYSVPRLLVWCGRRELVEGACKDIPIVSDALLSDCGSPPRVVALLNWSVCYYYYYSSMHCSVGCILCCNADWVLAVSANSLRDYSFHTHDTPNTPYRSNNSTRVSYCWMFWTKGSIVAIHILIYLHQSYARQWLSLYAHLWRHKQIILAVSTNMLICYHSAFGKPIHQLHLILAIEFHSSTMFWSINSVSSFLIRLHLFCMACFAPASPCTCALWNQLTAAE